MKTRRLASVAMLALLGTGCATVPGYDYSNFQAAKPASILVMPPLSMSPDIKATPSVWAQTTQPLAEAGYYVYPVTLVDEQFRQNGVMTAADAQEIPVSKLREVFGADAALYLKVTRYGTTYFVINSETRVDVEGRLIDLRTGKELWAGKASASSSEQQQGQGGLAEMLIMAVVKQVVGTTTDAAHGYAAMTQARLLAVPRHNGILPGPRSALYGQPLPAR